MVPDENVEPQLSLCSARYASLIKPIIWYCIGGRFSMFRVKKTRLVTVRHRLSDHLVTCPKPFPYLIISEDSSFKYRVFWWGVSGWYFRLISKEAGPYPIRPNRLGSYYLTPVLRLRKSTPGAPTITILNSDDNLRFWHQSFSSVGNAKQYHKRNNEIQILSN